MIPSGGRAEDAAGRSARKPVEARAGDPIEAPAELPAGVADASRAKLMPPLAAVTVVVGHYGSGKTNLALNLAYDAAAAGVQVTLADLDVVNPYFRSSDYRAELEAAGIRVIAPVLAGTALDTPSVSGTLMTAIDEADEAARRRAAELAGGAMPSVGRELPPRILVIDAGGDDVGATALGRFSARIAAAPHTVIGVVNRYRNLTQEQTEAAAVLREIEGASGLPIDGVVNNSHLKADTSAETVLDAVPFGERAAEALDVPLLRVAAPISVVPPILAAPRGAFPSAPKRPVRDREGDRPRCQGETDKDERRCIMARIIVDEGFCKGCGLCADACPLLIVELDHSRITPKGYHPAHCIDDAACTGCASCATMCPDVAITVER